MKQVALGEAHTLVLTANNTLYSFGWNDFGQLGVPTKTNETFKVHKVSGVGPCVSVAAGAISSFAVTCESR